ncbi:MAG TPA: prepilin peptidase [Acidimicrobiales bacterium]
MLVVGAGLVGLFVVGPFLTHAALRWVGWRVALPLLFGRVPPRSSLGHPRVLCRTCATPVAPLPAWPWLLRLGRCHACREPFARWPLLVELATGALFALGAWRVEGWRLVPVLALFAGLVAVSAVDILCSRIPTRFVYLTAAAVAVAAVPRLVEEPRSWVGAAVGGALCLGGLGVLHLASPAMLGFGDVRLGTLIGAVVGWAGWSAAEPVLDPLSRVVQAVFLAGIVGSLAGFVLLAIRRANRAYPFGPCLALGAVVTLLAL